MNTRNHTGKSTGVDLLHGPILPSLILFALPIIAFYNNQYIRDAK